MMALPSPVGQKLIYTSLGVATGAPQTALDTIHASQVVFIIKIIRE
jgi:hypothetical protein